jgi:hypothetical protein
MIVFQLKSVLVCVDRGVFARGRCKRGKLAGGSIDDGVIGAF